MKLNEITLVELHSRLSMAIEIINGGKLSVEPGWVKTGVDEHGNERGEFTGPPVALINEAEDEVRVEGDFTITDLDGNESAEALREFREVYNAAVKAVSLADGKFHDNWDCR